jgi:hypothetical protein
MEERMNHSEYLHIKNVIELQKQTDFMKLEKKYYDASYCPVGEIQAERKKVKLEEYDCKIKLLELDLKEITNALLKNKVTK